MLGHAPLGVLALGQPAFRNAVAAGAILPLTLALAPGTAAGGVVVSGAALPLSLALSPGAAFGGAAGDAIAFGAVLPLTLSLVPGAASAESAQSPVFGRGRPSRRGVAPGAQFELRLLLLPGRAAGSRHLDVVARGAILPAASLRISAGTANGDATGYDNDLLLLLDAA
jgi:hypothetical protein